MSDPKARKANVAYVGRQPSIYLTWAECDAQVSGFKGNRYKAYQNLEEAGSEWMKYSKGGRSGECVR